MPLKRNNYGAYNKNNKTRFNTSMLRSGLCDFSNAYILVKGNITVANMQLKINQIMPIKW